MQSDKIPPGLPGRLEIRCECCGHQAKLDKFTEIDFVRLGFYDDTGLVVSDIRDGENVRRIRTVHCRVCLYGKLY